MVENLPFVPWAVPLLLSELIWSDRVPRNAISRLRGLWPELRRQSEAYLLQNCGRQTQAEIGHLDVYLDSGLDLLNGRMACGHPECRDRAALRLCRSMGLIADTIWMTDLISEKFFTDGRPTEEELYDVLGDTLVLSRLWPLIDAGIIKFREPVIALCGGCKADFDGQVEETASALASKFLDQLRPERTTDGRLAIHTGDLYQPQMVYYIESRAKHSRDRTLLKNIALEIARESVHSALWTARDASGGRGSVFSNSKIGLAGLAAHEGRLVDQTNLRLLDESRSFSLPWVTDLNPAQIVQLRNEASSALPVFRENMARSLIYAGPGAPSSASVMFDS